MRVRRALALVGAVTATAIGCEGLPLVPKWDADMYMPLSTKAIYFRQFFPVGFILPNQSGSVNFNPLTQDLNSTIGNILKKVVTDPTRARSVLTLTIGKTLGIAAQDTLFIAPDSLGLYTTRPGGIVFPVALAAADASKTDSISVSQASIAMLQSSANSKAPLWIQLRGQVRNPSASVITITSADSIGIRLTMTVRIAISGR